MAFIEKCFCCSLPIACGFFSAYLLIAYLIAFAFELIWIILESSKTLPAAAVLLSAGYFAMSLFAALLLHGLATKNTLCLVTWMFAVTILTFPEAGLVIYMSVDHWGVAHIYGITELTCWLLRIIVNLIQIVLIQSLYSLWKDDDLMVKRMQTLGGMGMNGENGSTLNSQYYQNNGFEVEGGDQLDGGLKRYGSMPHLWSNLHMMPLQVPYHFSTTSSEFNASVYVPGVENPDTIDKKSHSLMDLRLLDHPSNISYAQQWLSGSINDPNSLLMQPTVYGEKPPKRAMSEINYSTVPSKLSRCKSVDTLDGSKSSHIIRNRSGFYAQPMENYGVPIYYGPLDGPDFLIYKKQLERLNSRNSLSNNSADEISKYRDVAL
ncbi:uncharacterized protein LOC109542578 isoform X1 [Dendroctonus ponderosae]|uniref:Uncharacterized protein n=2 Tax=Dendroctonus ponderosae TaxID=77166 RepID=U4TYG8_DENPD|nr:uncharacterized protein LOC109542578 isoform X1 [Dendroctonus ponderosae]ERL85068.1 hypothetical protein D910_02491 [Dendroctonus ponderosae]KAH1006358.1 hypothetical protein HUJ05_007099 [Dendroctonus ponderosae]